MNAEIDLPRRFQRLYGPGIRTWLENAIPGQTHCILLNRDPAMASPFVSSAAIERNTVVLKLEKIGRELVVRPEDSHSARLVDLEEDTLRKAEQAAARPSPVAIAERTYKQPWPFGPVLVGTAA
jgi:hypothetical protein